MAVAGQDFVWPDGVVVDSVVLGVFDQVQLVSDLVRVGHSSSLTQIRVRGNPFVPVASPEADCGAVWMARDERCEPERSKGHSLGSH